MPHSFSSERISFTLFPESPDIVLSRNSYSLAFLRRHASSSCPASAFSTFIILRYLFRNHISIFVISCIFCGVTPRRKASETTHSLRSSTACSFSSSSSPETSLREASIRLYMFISRQRTDFISAASKVGAMPITSPVAFICVPSVRRACMNLSNGQRGILTTQ